MDKLKLPNTKIIVGDIDKVLRTGKIGYLRKSAYEFIIFHMGFIAHYSLDGFKEHYKDTNLFAYRLLTSEFSNDMGYNKRRAEQRVISSTGQYNIAVADAMMRIVHTAELYVTRPMFNPANPSIQYHLVGYSTFDSDPRGLGESFPVYVGIKRYYVYVPFVLGVTKDPRSSGFFYAKQVSPSEFVVTTKVHRGKIPEGLLVKVLHDFPWLMTRRVYTF